MDLIEIFGILTIHYIGDFVLQTEGQAKGKSKNWSDLLAHTITYSIFVFFTIGILYGYAFERGESNFWFCLYFSLITFVAHTITDYFTSRLNNKLAPKEEVIMLKFNSEETLPFSRFPKGRSYHNLFVSIGFDQLLHYIQLFLTYQLLK